jgi:hypothetical protein
MLARALPPVLAAAAVLADGRGAHGLAFYLLVAAVPAAGAAALAYFGDLVELPGGAEGETRARAHAALSAVALALILVAASVRAPVRLEGGVPGLGVSAVVASLFLYGMQIVVAGFPTLAPAPRTRVRAD